MWLTCGCAQALAKGNTTKAVKCLRMELAPLQVDTVQLHKLANAVMCQDEEDLQKVMNWTGPENGSRQNLLNSLQVCGHCHMQCRVHGQHACIETLLSQVLFVLSCVWVFL